jgi:GxxExxY protein
MGDGLTEKTIGAAIGVHRILGPGLLESIHEEALCIELALRGVPFERQVERDDLDKGHRIRVQRLGLLIAGEVIVDLKSVSDLPELAMAQVLSYLITSGLERSLPINFGSKRLADGIKRISL